MSDATRHLNDIAGHLVNTPGHLDLGLYNAASENYGKDLSCFYFYYFARLELGKKGICLF